MRHEKKSLTGHLIMNIANYELINISKCVKYIRIELKLEKYLIEE